jgi:hypothetical protein
MTHPFRCRCGEVAGTVANERHATHSRCYCRDCQAFIRFLGRDADLLDAQGGSEAIQTPPRDISFERGFDRLACVRLSEKGLLRWYAACCNTPIGNTPPTAKLPFVGLSRACLENPSPTVEQSFGPVRFSLFNSGARGQPKPRPFGRLGFLFWMIANRRRAKRTGGFVLNPFFDTTSDRPRVEPRVLSDQERAPLYA